MSDFNEDKLKEKLLHEAKANTPDLWSKIGGQLPSKQVEPFKKNNNKTKYIKAFSSIAAILALVIGISIFTRERNTPPDIVLNDDEFIDIEKVPTFEDTALNKEPVNYGTLNFADGITPAEKHNQSGGSASACLDIIPFSEDLLSDMTWMGKVTILNAYYKDYKYDTFSDKFEPNGRLHNWLKTIVYEVKVDEIYLDDGKIKAGEILKVEQNCFNGCYLTDSALLDLKINRQYILPLFYAGEKILYEGSLDLQNYAEGDISRDGQYSIVYSFAPQIEVTLDNEYIFHDGWKSLITDKTVDVIMPSDNHEESFYDDKMKLRGDNDFIADLDTLIKRYK